jgi:hypothetical protein
MTRPSIILWATVGLVLACAGHAVAQAPQPAEIPPASFAGTEFVDSRGCVFNRVAVGDRVDWVPRVGPDRQPVCGFPPTGTAGVAPALPAAATGTQARPVQRPAIRTGQPSPPVAVRSVSVPTRPTTPGAPRAAAAAPGPVATTTPARVLLPPTLRREEVRLRGACATSAPRAPGHPDVRAVPCRPGPMHPRDLVHGARMPAVPASSPVALLRVERPSVPPGYRIAWRDGRLNPYRGIRTESGEAHTRMVWTDTVPRRLVPAD